MTDPQPPVEREQSGSHGRYLIRLAPGAEAEMTYRQVRPGVVSVDHTFTPPPFRGRNVAQRLMDRLIEDARAEGTRIVPVCSYAVTQFRRHPEWADLLAK